MIRLLSVHELRRALTDRRVQALCLAALVAYLIDRAMPPPAPHTSLAFWGIFVAIASAIGHFIHAAGDAVIAVLVTTVNWLRAGLVILGQGLKSGIFELGRGIARALRAVKTFIVDTLPRFVRWTFDKLQHFEVWLKDKFAPVFRFLSNVRKRLNQFYATFIRPIIDTIEFVRAVNRVLLAFHITFLQALDRKLAQLEQRIEEPFLWVNAKLNEIWNVLDRVVTLDGFFQRLTLVKSLARYAPEWLRVALTSSQKGVNKGRIDGLAGAEYPVDEPFANGKELADAYRGRDNRMSGLVDELVPLWFEATQIERAPDYVP